MSKSDSDNDLSLFREAGGRAKVGGGEGERERTERGDEDMVLLVVIV
jgi:phosphoserine phosphatase